MLIWHTDCKENKKWHMYCVKRFQSPALGGDGDVLCTYDINSIQMSFIGMRKHTFTLPKQVSKE